MRFVQAKVTHARTVRPLAIFELHAPSALRVQGFGMYAAARELMRNCDVQVVVMRAGGTATGGFQPPQRRAEPVVEVVANFTVILLAGFLSEGGQSGLEGAPDGLAVGGQRLRTEQGRLMKLHHPVPGGLHAPRKHPEIIRHVRDGLRPVTVGEDDCVGVFTFTHLLETPAPAGPWAIRRGRRPWGDPMATGKAASDGSRGAGDSRRPRSMAPRMRHDGRCCRAACRSKERAPPCTGARYRGSIRYCRAGHADRFRRRRSAIGWRG